MVVIHSYENDDLGVHAEVLDAPNYFPRNTFRYVVRFRTPEGRGLGQIPAKSLNSARWTAAMATEQGY